MATRKRRAPGTSPQGQQNNLYPQEADQFTAWNDPSMASTDLGSAFNDQSLFDFTGNMGNMGAQTGGTSSHNRIVSLDGLDTDTVNGDPASYSGQLVRRNPNQQLTARGRNAWDAFNNGNQGQWPEAVEEEDDRDLEQRAMVAKRDAQSKRKQIPPFVQKLSSFLDNNKNTNLIRWSDDGNSFIVLDEDEFARTLIPELFKHNNYASFVRQLNMYGFHKKVGLSDNSMKASEAKAKAPSEYYNKYFKRGRSELLWLIQKPKNPPGNTKRKRDDDGKQGDSDEDRKYTDTGGGMGQGVGFGEENVAVRHNTEMAMIPRAEYNSLRTEVRTLQQQQKVISNVLAQIRRQNDQLYQQATAFQTLHERHENSINAILTFLATFYNRTLENNNGGTNLADLFGSAMPPQQPHGSVVDVGDYQDRTMTKSPQLARQSRRPLALLPAPAVKDLGGDRATTMSPSVRSTASPIPKSSNRQPAFNRSPVSQSRNPHVESFMSAGSPLKTDSASPSQVPTPLPENDEIMSAIQNANANANAGQSTTQGAPFDFSAALADYQSQGGNAPLTPQQRNDVLSLMANNVSAASPNSSLAQNSNNAVASPLPPSLPDLSQFQDTQHSLDLLQKMAEEQNTRVQSLQERLQPLSPSGTIPGLDDSYFNNATVGDPGQFDLDIDSFIPNEDYLTQNAHNGHSTTNDLNLPDLNYDLNNPGLDLNGTDLTGDASGEGLLGFDGPHDNRVESVSSSAPSPAVTIEDVDEDRQKRSPKRRKK